MLVSAQDSESAIAAARRVVEDKLIKNGIFDSAVDFTDCAADAGGLKAEMTIAAVLKAGGILAIGKWGKDRWGDIPPALQVSTKRFPCSDPRGMEQAREAMLITLKHFKKTMKSIRYHIANYTDDELFNEVPGMGEVEVDGEKIYDAPRGFREDCEEIGGQTADFGVFLFGPRGEHITAVSHLQGLLDNSEDDPFYVTGGVPVYDEDMNQPLWIVPFDCHM